MQNYNLPEDPWSWKLFLKDFGLGLVFAVLFFLLCLLSSFIW